MSETDDPTARVRAVCERVAEGWDVPGILGAHYGDQQSTLSSVVDFARDVLAVLDAKDAEIAALTEERDGLARAITPADIGMVPATDLYRTADGWTDRHGNPIQLWRERDPDASLDR